STHLDKDLEKKVKEELETRKATVKPRYSWSYDENYDIFTSTIDGKNIKRLTKELGYDAEGAYSPDGSLIVFASNRAGYSEKLSDEDAKLFKADPSYMMDIYIMNSDGSNVRRLTNSKGYDGGPFFSADGKKITWRRFSPNGATAEIFTMNVDGSEEKQITRLNAMSWAPFFHPSGEYIVFGSNILGFSNFELFIVRADGQGHPRRVTFEDGFDGLASFSPDGNKITWTHRNEKGESHIYIADWDHAGARRLLNLEDNLGPTRLFSHEIREQDARNIIRYLTRADFKGRMSGSAEEQIYTSKIAELFRELGLHGGAPDGGFFQDFDFVSGVEIGEGNLLELKGKVNRSLKLGEDFNPVSFSASGELPETPVVFAGYGIKAPATEKMPAYDSYSGLDVRGRWVLILKDVPQNVERELRQHLHLYSRLQHKLTVAKNLGAVGVVVASGPLTPGAKKLSAFKFEGGMNSSSIFVQEVSLSVAEELVKSAGHDLHQLQRRLDQGDAVAGFAIPSVYLKTKTNLNIRKSKARNV
ncbi:MAG: biopolymer transporter Tol, partial [Bdellovibrionaceae bacterium]|nr:biopolymer transporter Tol [Pseudobdellovibrionaceae bacterium]